MIVGAGPVGAAAAILLAQRGVPCLLLDRYPQWRLGQVVANVAEWADQTVWDIEDEQWLGAARTHLDQLAAYEKAKA